MHSKSVPHSMLSRCDFVPGHQYSLLPETHTDAMFIHNYCARGFFVCFWGDRILRLHSLSIAVFCRTITLRTVHRITVNTAMKIVMQTGRHWHTFTISMAHTKQPRQRQCQNPARYLRFPKWLWLQMRMHSHAMLNASATESDKRMEQRRQYVIYHFWGVNKQTVSGHSTGSEWISEEKNIRNFM